MERNEKKKPFKINDFVGSSFIVKFLGILRRGDLKSGSMFFFLFQKEKEKEKKKKKKERKKITLS